MVISQKLEEYELDFGIKLKLNMSAPHNFTKNVFYPKRHLLPVLWKCLTFGFWYVRKLFSENNFSDRNTLLLIPHYFRICIID